MKKIIIASSIALMLLAGTNGFAETQGVPIPKRVRVKVRRPKVRTYTAPAKELSSLQLAEIGLAQTNLTRHNAETFKAFTKATQERLRRQVGAVVQAQRKRVLPKVSPTVAPRQPGSKALVPYQETSTSILMQQPKPIQNYSELVTSTTEALQHWNDLQSDLAAAIHAYYGGKGDHFLSLTDEEVIIYDIEEMPSVLQRVGALMDPKTQVVLYNPSTKIGKIIPRKSDGSEMAQNSFTGIDWMTAIYPPSTPSDFYKAFHRRMGTLREQEAFEPLWKVLPNGSFESKEALFDELQSFYSTQLKDYPSLQPQQLTLSDGRTVLVYEIPIRKVSYAEKGGTVHEVAPREDVMILDVNTKERSLMSFYDLLEMCE